MKKCPFCAEEILDEAIKCKHCGSMLKKGSSFSLLGLCGAFLAVVGVAVSCTAGMVGNSTVVILAIVLLLVGAGLGAKYK